MLDIKEIPFVKVITAELERRQASHAVCHFTNKIDA